MEENKARSIFLITSELHDDITEVYELMMDEENEEAFKKIEGFSNKLRHLKSNLVVKDD